jgi:hypothetical protein
MFSATYRQNVTSGKIKFIIIYAHEIPLHDSINRMSICYLEKELERFPWPTLIRRIFMLKIFDATYRKIYNYAIKIGDSHFVGFSF